VATASARKQLDLGGVTLCRQDDVVIGQLDQVVRVLQEQAFDEFVDGILGVVEDFLGFGHRGTNFGSFAPKIGECRTEMGGKQQLTRKEGNQDGKQRFHESNRGF